MRLLVELIKSVVIEIVAIFAAILIWKVVAGLLKILLIGALAIGVFAFIKNHLDGK